MSFSENIALLWPNYFQPTVLATPTIGGGSWTAENPLSNLFEWDFSLDAISTDLQPTSTRVDIDLKMARQVDMIAIGRHNGSTTGTVQVILSDNADYSSPIHQSAQLPLWPTGATAEDVYGYNLNWYALVGHAARYVRLQFSDPDNPAGCLSISRPLIGKVFQPALNPEYGTTGIQIVDPTVIQSSQGGLDWFDVYRKYRVLKFQLNWLTETEAFDQTMEMDRTLGMSGWTFVAFNPGATGFRRLQQSFQCNLRNLNALEFPRFSAYSKSWELKEMLGAGSYTLITIDNGGTPAETQYLTDDSGNRITDDSGNYIIAG